MSAFACGHPRDLWNAGRRRSDGRFKAYCRECARTRARASDAAIVAFTMCPDCATILPQTRQGLRKGQSARHQCKPATERDWQGVLCMRCGALAGKRARALCAPCKRTNTMWHYNNDPAYRQKVIDAAKHRVHLKRAAQQRGEVITVAALIERDGDSCYICGVTVRDDLAIGHPLKANIDHVVPISRGGMHSLDNVRLSCRGCNSAKGARLAA